MLIFSSEFSDSVLLVGIIILTVHIPNALLNLSYFEPTASGWLKVHRYSEVPEQDGYLPLPSIYAYRLAIG